MRKVIGAFNMTLDGNCDHTAGIADAEIHQHYNDLLRSAGTLVYGRITYQLMEVYWPTIVKNPTGHKAEDEFAVLIDGIDKIAFSHTLKSVDWNKSILAKRSIEEEITELRHKTGKDILIGSRSLIVTCLNLGLIDEFQICIQPIIAGKGLSLFENIDKRINLTLRKTKLLSTSGSMVMYYEPERK